MKKNPIAAGEYTISADKGGSWSGEDQGSMTLVIVGLELTATDKSWLPKGGKESNSNDYTATIIPNNLKGKIEFVLEDVTNYTGFCCNAGKSKQPDLKFKAGQTGFDPLTDNVAQTTDELNSVFITIECLDYGAYGKLKASATITVENNRELTVKSRFVEDDGDVLDYVTIPRDDDGDKMADGWEEAYINKIKEVKKIEDLTADFDEDYATTSYEYNMHKGRKGDLYNTFDEYRGLIITDCSLLGKEYKTYHYRLNPLTKQLVVYNEPFLFPKKSWKGFDKVRVAPEVFDDLGYETVFLLEEYFNTKTRQVCTNGTSQQKTITIKGDYKNAPSGTEGENFGSSSPGIPMTSGKIIIYFKNVASHRANMTYRINLFDHETGHSCFLFHHRWMQYACPMRWAGGSELSSSFIANFCDGICKAGTKIK